MAMTTSATRMTRAKRNAVTSAVRSITKTVLAMKSAIDTRKTRLAPRTPRASVDMKVELRPLNVASSREG